ncbi:LysO family transporter [Sinanaerobacter sp. ZZT-01]|uniref:LysO family transporter n=1 Tax=Sinanaerobacter sp. ZZT-01 TaxID=3111540 RepID=UPI002D779AAB|nr:LysO family transporter [Sinanaerobacter sp. ZZT-01]WRR92594.1 LysO family transporter [Sinanaerobacter sp. ZZT-01]
MSYTLLLYLGLMGLGIFIGSKKMSKEREYKWIPKIQYIAVIVLIAALGVQIGSDDNVVASLKEIGVSAFVISVFSMAGSVLCVYFVRKWIGLNKEGVRDNE